MQNNYKIAKFSLMEIMIALGIILIGFIGVIALFPVGLQAQKKSSNESFATDATDQFLTFNSSKIKEDLAWADAFPMEKYTGDEMELTWSTTSLIDNPNLNILYPVNDPDNPGEVFDPALHQKGLFKLQQVSQGNIDFQCIIHSWQTAGSIILHVVCSYPANLPPAARESISSSLRIVTPDTWTPYTIFGVPTSLASLCGVEKTTGGGFTTTITGCLANDDGTYTIELTVAHDGCSTPNCHEIEYCTVEAVSGTYSGVTFSGITGSLDPGSFLSNFPFDGFQLYGLSGLGNGQAGSFTVTYTLTGGLQDQTVSTNSGPEMKMAMLRVADFEEFMDCYINEYIAGCFGEAPNNAFRYGMYSESSISIKNLNTVDITGGLRSDSSTLTLNNLGDLSVTGNLVGQGDVNMSGNVSGTIAGDVESENSVSTGGATITGSAGTVGSIGDYSLFEIPAPTGPTDPNYDQPITIITGDYIIDGTENLNGTLYVTGTLTIKDGQNITGAGAIVAGGDIHVNTGNGTVGANAESLYLYTLSGDIHMSNIIDVTINGALYAPAGTIHLNNVTSVTVKGGLYSADTLMINNVDTLTIEPALDFEDIIPPGIVAQINATCGG